MTLFIAIALLLLALAIAYVVPALLRPPVEPRPASDRRLAVMAAGLRELDTELAAHTLDEAEYREARQELERQALEADGGEPRERASTGGRRAGLLAALVVGVVVPVAAAGLYLHLGQPAAVGAAVPPPAATQADPRIAAMITHLRDRLAQAPDDADGWLLLARSYNATGKTGAAIEAYAKATALRPKDANLLVEYANTVGLAQDRDLGGQPEQLLQRALKLDPDNPNALALAGQAALQAGHNDDAVRHWTRLEKLLPPDAAGLPQLKSLIARAEGAPPPAAADTAIQGSVSVGPGLAGKVTPTDTVFVFARASNGPPMPVAVVRAPAANLPVAFTLDDAHAMTPRVRLSQYAKVDVYARISHTGSASARPGDLEGRLDGVKLGSRGVKLVVDQVLDQ